MTVDEVSFNEKLELKGRVRVTVRDAKTAKVLQVVEVENLIVTAGKDLVAKILNEEGDAVPDYCAVGSGSTAPAAGDTALESEIGRLQVTDRSRSGNQIVYSTFFSSADANGTWNESGLFNDQTAGTMLCRALFSSTISKDSTKTVTVDWTITVG